MPSTSPLRCATQWRGARDISKYQKPAAESEYHNPEPLVWILCHANEAMVGVGVETTTPVDTGSHISALSERFCIEMGLKILPLRNLIGVVCISREHVLILYKGYIEAKLTIPNLPQYHKDVLFLIILDHK